METVTQYAEREGVSIAYQIFGDASTDLVIVPGIISHVEYMHELPGYTKFLRSMASRFRVIVFDKRGNGMSTSLSGDAPTLEQRMDDIRFVMDDANSTKATILGISEGGSLSALFAAMHPEKVDKLILFGAFASLPRFDRLSGFPKLARDWLIGLLMKRYAKSLLKTWGDGSFTRTIIPGRMMIDNSLRRKFKEFERKSTTPPEMAKMFALLRYMDVRPFLENVRCPTLVMHSHDDKLIPISSGAELHDGIDGSELLELADAGHTPFMSEDSIISDKILEFAGELTQGYSRDADRQLAAILFNDIVGSTSLQSSLGDHLWKEKMEKFDSLCRSCVGNYDGRFVKSLGDGILAVFNGPTRAIHCAVTIKEMAKQLDLEIRSGLHVGEIEKIRDDVVGININAASRIQGLAMADQVLVSDVLRSLAFGSGITFQDVGEFSLKGFDQKWRLAEVCVTDDQDARVA